MTTLENPQDTSTINGRVEELRKDLKFFNQLQTALIARRHGEAAHNPAHSGALGKAIEWVDTYSPEYELAFKELVRDSLLHNEDFLDRFSKFPNETMKALENRIEQYHVLELELIGHIDKGGKIPHSFAEWHKEFGKPLVKILYSHPELFDKYMLSHDQHADVQDEILREIEDALYTEED